VIPSANPTWDRPRPRAIPAAIFWPTIATIVFALGDITLTLSGEMHFLATQISLAMLIGFVPLVYIYLSRSFYDAVLGLSSVLWTSDAECCAWLEARQRRLFQLRDWRSGIVTLGVVVLGLDTVFVLGLPFHSIVVKVAAVLGFTYILLLCGHGLYTYLDLLVTLHELTGRPPRVPFLYFPHPSVARLGNHFFSLVICCALSYVLLLVAVVNGPYGLNAWMRWWLSVLAFYPLVAFVMWVGRVAFINQAIRASFLDYVNGLVNARLADVSKAPSPEAYAMLKTTVELQTTVISLRVTPVDLQLIVTFGIAALTAATQIVLLTNRLMRPGQ
jgi:hypothetical protein